MTVDQIIEELKAFTISHGTNTNNTVLTSEMVVVMMLTAFLVYPATSGSIYILNLTTLPICMSTVATTGKCMR